MDAVGQQGDAPRLLGEVEQDRVGRGLDSRVQLGGVLAHGLEQLHDADQLGAEPGCGLQADRHGVSRVDENLLGTYKYHKQLVWRNQVFWGAAAGRAGQ